MNERQIVRGFSAASMAHCQPLITGIASGIHSEVVLSINSDVSREIYRTAFPVLADHVQSVLGGWRFSRFLRFNHGGDF